MDSVTYNFDSVLISRKLMDKYEPLVDFLVRTATIKYSEYTSDNTIVFLKNNQIIGTWIIPSHERR